MPSAAHRYGGEPVAVTALSPARALRRPRHLDLRAVLGVVLMLFTIAGSMVVWSALSDTRAVLVATRDVPAGAVLSSGDVSITHLRLDDSIYQAAVPADNVAALVGKQLAEPVHAHQILVQSQLNPRAALAAGQVAMTIAMTAENAGGGEIRAGDSVEVFQTINKGKPDSKTAVVLPRVVVYSVGYDQQSTVSNSGGSTSGTAPTGVLKSVTLAVSQDQAAALALAKWNSDLDLVLLPPQQPSGGP